jgi:hypothetical protein
MNRLILVYSCTPQQAMLKTPQQLFEESEVHISNEEYGMLYNEGKQRYEVYRLSKQRK